MMVVVILVMFAHINITMFRGIKSVRILMENRMSITLVIPFLLIKKELLLQQEVIMMMLVEMTPDMSAYMNITTQHGVK